MDSDYERSSVVLKSSKRKFQQQSEKKPTEANKRRTLYDDFR